MAAFKVGHNVEVTGKDVRGVVAYIGSTQFAAGKWIGVNLDSPKGKNNGSVQGKQYFQCEENHGMFVRASQLTLLDDQGQPIEGKASPSSSNTSPASVESTPKTRSRLPVFGSGSKSSSQSNLAELSVTPIKDTPQGSENASKRSSFVETGFVENLKPHYTPGPALSPAMGFNVEERLTNLQQATEIDRLQAEVRDLTEKLETLRVKRSQDKEKLKELDKARLQLEQMVEFKSRIMESQTSLQRDLQRAKQETREAIEARERHADEMADLAETVEMATLDKEMAEEKAEALQIELEQITERHELVTTELELLRAEMNFVGPDGDNATKKVSSSSLEMKALEQNNAKMKETLVRLRDLSAHEKHENQKMQKELDVRRSEIAELSRTKEKLSSRLEDLEQTLADLQEQVDAALGAEEMVENLTTKNLNLEERVKEVEEELADLEAIADMNEQLQENSRETELELREELDLAQSAKRESERERDAAQETLSDREMTINKFRELVQRLQEESQELREQVQRETSKPLSALPEMIDFKKMFAESKAHTKAIDLELRRIDVQQSNQHVQYLTAYMPESFMARGGDHDAMLLLLLLPRLLRKADIVVEQVRDKFPAVPDIDRASVLRSHAVEQFAFRSRLSFWIYSLQGVLEQLLRSLTSCSPEVLLRVGVLYSDLALKERALDHLVELLRHDQLDENVNLDNLEKCVMFCKSVASSHLPPSSDIHTHQLAATCRALSAACDVLHTDAAILLSLIQGGQQEGISQLLTDIQTSCDTLRQQLKQCRRRIPTGSMSTELPLSGAIDLFEKLVRALHDSVRACMQHVTASGDAETGIAPSKVMELVQASSEHSVEGELEPLAAMKGALTTIHATVTSLTQLLQDYDADTNQEDKTVAPIVLRAQCVKKELEETKMLRQKLETREADIKELKKALKLKQEELSEMVIRKDLSESKLGNVHKDYALNTEKLQRKLDDTLIMLKRKEKEFEETMDHLQADIDSLESERGELKEKVKHISKKVLIEGLAKSVASSSGGSGSPTGPSLPVAVRDSPMLVQQIQDLRLALRHAQNETYKSRMATASSTLKNLPPLKVGKKLHGEQVEKTSELSKKASLLLKELQSTLANPQLVDISSRKPGEIPVLEKNAPSYQLTEQRARVNELKSKAENLQAEVLKHLMAAKPGARAQSSFAAFPTVEFAKALQEQSAERLGRLELNKATPTCKTPASVPLLLDLEALRKLHATICI